MAGMKMAPAAMLVCLPLLLPAPGAAQFGSLPHPVAKTGGNYMLNYYLPPSGSSTPWWPSWSPDGKALAFAMDGSIWRIRVGESTAEEIVYAPEYLSSPEWSPDGRWVAYTADDGRAIHLRLLELASGRSTALTEGASLNLDPAWSPDGRRLAYVSTEPNGYYNIRVMEIDEGRRGPVLAVTTDHGFGRDRLYFGEIDLHISPTWSPDGRELVFVSNRGIPLGSGALWRAPVEAGVMDTGKARIIHKEETLYRTRPHWSRDGARIVYASHLGGQDTNLFVLPAGGGEPYKLSFGRHDSFHPRWSPDGEWIAYLSNEDGLPQLRLLKAWGGSVRQIPISARRWSRPMGRVEVRVVDAATGRPTPARVYPRAADGKSYTPAGSYERISSLNERLFHTSGSYVAEVPPGSYSVEVVKGFEYEPARASAEVKAGETAALTVRLGRILDLKAKGWYSGSNHVHMNYGGNLHNTPENLFFMSAAEDADVIGHQVANKDNRILDYESFVPGRAAHPLSTRERIMHTGQEYRPPFYGHIALFNLRDHLVSPFTTGYEGTAIESLYPSNTDVFRHAREQGGIGAYVHPYADRDPLEADLSVARGFPVDLALESFQYLELWSTAGRGGPIVWHHALNSGFKVPVTGGEDSISNLHRTRLLGATRGYFFLGPGKLSWESFRDALLAGRGFVTNGPLLAFTVDGKLPGSEIRLPASGGRVVLEGALDSIVPVDALQVVQNGRVVEEIPLAADRRSARFRKQLRVERSGWVTLQAEAATQRKPVEDSRPMATTNPVYIHVGGQPIRSAESADYFVRWIEKLIPMAEAHPGWRSAWEKAHVLGQFREAREVFVRRKAEAAN